jgi:hypothetical protein
MDYKIGDSVWFEGGYSNSSSTERLFGKGFVTQDYIMEKISKKELKKGFRHFKNREKCKTNFSIKIGSKLPFFSPGTKEFLKKEISLCRILLVEKKGNFEEYKVLKIYKM